MHDDYTQERALQKNRIRRRGIYLLPNLFTTAALFAVILMVHHDRDTLTWSDTPYTPLVARDENGNMIDYPQLTSDPPPWWRAQPRRAAASA